MIQDIGVIEQLYDHWDLPPERNRGVEREGSLVLSRNVEKNVKLANLKLHVSGDIFVDIQQYSIAVNTSVTM